MRGTIRAVVNEVDMMKELSDNHKHGETREMIIVLKGPGDTLEQI